MPKNIQEPFVNGQLVTDPAILEERIRDLRADIQKARTIFEVVRLEKRVKFREQQLEALLNRGTALDDLAKFDAEDDLI